MPAINATSAPFDLTNVTSTENILEFIQEVNVLTGEIFMMGMLLAGWVILFVSMRTAGNKDAVLAASFIIAVMAIFFRALEFISTAKVVVIMIVFAAVFVITLQRKD